MKRITILLCLATGTSLATPGSASKVPKTFTLAVQVINPVPAGASHVSFRRSQQPELR